MCCSLNQYRSRIGIFAQYNNLKPKTTKTGTPTKSKTKLTTILNLLISFLLIFPNTSFITKKQHNKTQHTINGNNYLSLVHWNKGRSLFHNKTNDIDHILTYHKPHIFSICEANTDKIINDTPLNTYSDYKIEHTKMSSSTNRSRNVLLVKDDIIYNRH